MSESIKILACCHKAIEPIDHIVEIMKQQPMLCPIMIGEISKQGLTEQYGRKCYNDNSGDNLSYLNPHLNEMTGIYWAWKHYDELDNPEYIGFCHYRRFFINDVIKCYKEYDAIGVVHSFPRYNIIRYIGDSMKRPYDIFSALKVVLTDYETQEEDFYNIYAREIHNWYYFCNNMFITKREIFFDYCKWIFPKISILCDIFLTKSKFDNYYINDTHGKRTIGYVAEILTGYFFHTYYHDYRRKHNLSDINTIVIPKQIFQSGL